LIECAELYRLIYYIERIRTFIGTFGWDGFRIRKWIDAFTVFEEDAASRYDSGLRANRGIISGQA
jgi:hypothetical protein